MSINTSINCYDFNRNFTVSERLKESVGNDLLLRSIYTNNYKVYFFFFMLPIIQSDVQTDLTSLKNSSCLKYFGPISIIKASRESLGESIHL